MPVVVEGRVNPVTGSVEFQNTSVDGSATGTGTVSSAAVVGSVTGNNIGVGEGLFAGATGLDSVTLNFKGLVGGTGIRVVQDHNDVTLIATGEIQTNVTFASLIDGPGPFSPRAVLVGSNDASNLDWTPSATTANTVLTYTGSGFAWTPVAATGVKSVQSDGLVRANTTNGVVSLTLAPTGVVPGTYSAANIVVDTQGRVTHATSTVGLSPSATLTGDVTGTGVLANIVTRLANNGVVPGTYTKPVVDATGRVTGNGALTASDITTALGFVPLSSSSSLNSVSLTGNPTAPTAPTADSSSLVATTAFVHNALAAQGGVQSITVNGNGITVQNGTVTGSGSGSGTIGLSLTPTGVVPGSYSNPTVTVNPDGRITGISAGSASGGSASIPASGVNAGSYLNANITVGADGRITAASNGSAGSGGGGSITLTGDVTASGTGTVAATLANVPGLAAGSYSNPNVTVDAKGRVTAISNGAAPSGGSGTSASSGPARYSLTVALDGDGNVAPTSTFTGLPNGWTATRDGTNQVTVTHGLGAFPVHVSTIAYNAANSQWAVKTPNGNPPTQFSVGVNTTGTTPNTFTIYGLSGSSVSGATNSPVIVSVLI